MILNENTQKMLNEEIERLPDYLQTSLDRLDWEDRIVQVAAKHRLNTKQTQRFVTEVAMVLIGLADPGLLYNQVTQSIGVSDAIARKIITDTMGHVFDPLQNILQDVTRSKVPVIQNKIAQVKEEQQKEDGLYLDEGASQDSTLGSPTANGLAVFDVDAVIAKENTKEEDYTKIAQNSMAQNTQQTKTPQPVKPAYVAKDPYHENVEMSDVDPFLKPKVKNWYKRKK